MQTSTMAATVLMLLAGSLSDRVAAQYPMPEDVSSPHFRRLKDPEIGIIAADKLLSVDLDVNEHRRVQDASYAAYISYGLPAEAKNQRSRVACDAQGEWRLDASDSVVQLT